MDPQWHAVQPNDVGVDELLQMCREILAVEPEWCVNTGFGEPRSGAELVEYVNGAPSTKWGAMRAANGHPEPYKVRYWNVGNEMYGHWQLGHMALDQYVIKHNLFADAMRKVDPSIYIIAPGGFVDEMTTGQGIVDNSGSPLVQYGSDRDWAGGMLQHCWGKFDALATHAYPPENKHFDLTTGKNEDIKQTLVAMGAGAGAARGNHGRLLGGVQEALPRARPRQGEGVLRRVGLSLPAGLQGLPGDRPGFPRVLPPFRFHRDGGLHHGNELAELRPHPFGRQRLWTSLPALQAGISARFRWP